MRVLLLVDDPLLEGILTRSLSHLPGVHVGNAGSILHQSIPSILRAGEPAIVIVDDRLDLALQQPERMTELIAELRRSAPRTRVRMQIWVLGSYAGCFSATADYTGAGADRVIDKRSVIRLEELGKLVTDHRDSIVHTPLPAGHDIVV